MPTLNQFPLLGDSLFLLLNQDSELILGLVWWILIDTHQKFAFKTVTAGWLEFRIISWIYVGSRELMSLPIEISWLLNCDLWSFPFVSKKSRSLEGGVLFGNGTLPLFSGSHLLSTGYFYSFKAAGGGSLRGFECSNFSLVKIVFFLEMSEAIDQLTWKDLEVQLVSKQLVHFFKYLGEIIFSNKQNNSLKFADSTHQVWKPRWMLLMINIFRSLDAKTLILKTFWRRHFERCMIYMYIYIYIFFLVDVDMVSFWVWCVFLVFSYFCGRKKHIYIYLYYICWIDVEIIWGHQQFGKHTCKMKGSNRAPRIQPEFLVLFRALWRLLCSCRREPCCDLPVSVLEDHPI